MAGKLVQISMNDGTSICIPGASLLKEGTAGSFMFGKGKFEATITVIDPTPAEALVAVSPQRREARALRDAINKEEKKSEEQMSFMADKLVQISLNDGTSICIPSASLLEEGTAGSFVFGQGNFEVTITVIDPTPAEALHDVPPQRREAWALQDVIRKEEVHKKATVSLMTKKRAPEAPLTITKNSERKSVFSRLSYEDNYPTARESTLQAAKPNKAVKMGRRAKRNLNRKVYQTKTAITVEAPVATNDVFSLLTQLGEDDKVMHNRKAPTEELSPPLKREAPEPLTLHKNLENMLEQIHKGGISPNTQKLAQDAIPEEQAVDILLRNISESIAPLLRGFDIPTLQSLSNKVTKILPAIEEQEEKGKDKNLKPDEDGKTENKVAQVNIDQVATTSKLKEQKSKKLDWNGRLNKKYSFSKESTKRIFQIMLKWGLQLPQPKRPEESQLTDDPLFCPYHRCLGHTIEDCFIFKNLVEGKLKAGDIQLSEKYILPEASVPVKDHLGPGLKEEISELATSVKKKRILMLKKVGKKPCKP